MKKRFFHTTLAVLVCAPGVWGQIQSDELDPDVIELRSRPITDDEFHLVPEEGDEARVELLVSRLAGPDYAAREAASTELIEIGAQAFSLLRAHYHRADDLETRLRIERIVRSAYLNHHVLDRHGFLGITMNSLDAQRLNQLRERNLAPDGLFLPDGKGGVWVRQVLDGTAAHRAGVQKDDLLIALNGEEIQGTGNEIQQNFSALIRKHPPGSKVRIDLLRGAEQHTVEAVLGRPPESVARDSRIIKVSALYHVVSERFLVWWERYFLNPPDVEADRDDS